MHGWKFSLTACEVKTREKERVEKEERERERGGERERREKEREEREEREREREREREKEQRMFVRRFIWLPHSHLLPGPQTRQPGPLNLGNTLLPALAHYTYIY